MTVRYGSPLRLLALLAYAAGSAVVFWFWLGLDLNGDVFHDRVNVHQAAKVPDMIYGRAHRPYVQRALVPVTIRLVRAALPDDDAGALRRRLLDEFPGLRSALIDLGWEPRYLAEYLIAVVLMYAALVGFLFAFRGLFNAVFRAPEPVGDLAPLLALAILPVFFAQGAHYLYDFATLLLFTASLVALRRRDWRLYYLLLLLALLNKETAVLLPLAFGAVSLGRLDPRALRRHLLAQLALVVLTRAALALAFRGTPGGAYEFHLPFNLSALLRRYDTAGLSFVVLVGLAVLYRFHEKPRFLRRALVILPPLVLAYLAFGFYGEIRVFYEAYPVVLLLALHTAADLAGWPLLARSEEQPSGSRPGTG